MTADFTAADVWNEATGTWLHIACSDCVHMQLSPTYRILVCMHDDSRGISIDKPTCFTSRMNGAPCGPGGRLYEERKA